LITLESMMKNFDHNDLVAIENERDNNDVEKEDEENQENIEEEEEKENNLNAKTSFIRLKSTHNLRAISAAILVSAGLMSTGALAQDSNTASLRSPGWYVGGSVGRANADIGNSDVNSNFSGSIDDRDTGWKVFGGGMFNQNLGLELGYVDLGTTSVRGNVGAVGTNMNSDAQGVELALVGVLPLGQYTSYGRGFSLTGKVGLFRWKADDRQYSCSAGSCTTRGTLRDTDPVIGVGVKYDFSRNTALRLEYEQFQNVANADYNLWTVGFQWGF